MAPRRELEERRRGPLCLEVENEAPGRDEEQLWKRLDSWQVSPDTLTPSLTSSATSRSSEKTLPTFFIKFVELREVLFIAERLIWTNVHPVCLQKANIYRRDISQLIQDMN